MIKVGIAMIATCLIATPVRAADRNDVRPGAFVGARLTIGGKTGRPQAALAIAPTQSRVSQSGMSRTRIGEGIALSPTPRARPALTLSGVRLDTAFDLRPDSDLNPESKLGISKGGWVAIGVGTVAIVVGGLYLYADHLADCDEGECN